MSTACVSCGQCCTTLELDEDGHALRPGIIPCKRLKILPNGKTYCTIYNRRLGSKLGKGLQCVMRKDCPFDYEGCPQNDPEGRKPLFRVDFKNKTVTELNRDGTEIQDETSSKDNI